MWILAARVGAGVIELACCVVVGLLGGQYLGGRLGSPNLGLYVGGGLGVMAATFAVRRLVKQLNREDP